MTMLKPIFITGSLVHGGAERHSITVMNRLLERGHECHAVYIKNDPSQLDRIQATGRNTVHCLNADRFLDPKAIADLAAQLSAIRPSIIVATNGYALMYASLARIKANQRIPLLATFHTTKLIGLKEHLKALIDRPFFWAAEQAVFVCAMQRRYWLRRGLASRRNGVIYNGVDTEHFRDRLHAGDKQAWRRELGCDAADFVIGISAVLRPEKNHVVLVDAVAALRAMGIPAHVLMIGDGPMRKQVEARSQELGVAAQVKITGLRQDVRPYVAICDVMVLCSSSETFSLAALEAMSMGKPVVHSDVGGAAEMIRPGCNGYLYPEGNTGKLVESLALLSDRITARAMGAAARTIVEAEFSERAMIDRYEKLMSDFCNGTASQREFSEPSTQDTHGCKL